MDALESSSPQPDSILKLNLQDEQRINLPGGTGSAKLFSECTSHGANYLGRFRNRNKWTKSVKNSSTPLPICLVLDNSSSFVRDSLGAVSSDVVVNDVPKAGKSVGRSSRKKKKQKGKEYRRSTCRNNSVELESQCNESASGASVSVTSVNNNAACLNEHILERNLSEKTISSFMSVRNITNEKDDSLSNDDIESSTTSLPCTSKSYEMDVSEPIDSFSRVFAGEEISCSSTTYLTNTLTTSQIPKIVLSTFDENSNDVHPKQNNSNCYAIAPMHCLFPGKCKSDNSENWIDDVEAQLSIKDEGGLNSSNGCMVSDSRSSDTSFDRLTATSCDLNSELSNDCWLKDDDDTSNNTERALYSSQACSSNELHPVLSGKRGRLARIVSANIKGTSKFGSVIVHGRTGKNSYLSVWQKVQRVNTEECIYKAKNANNVFRQACISSKSSGTRVRLNTSVRLRQTQSGKTCRYPCSDERVGQTCKTNTFSAISNTADSSEISAKSINGNSITDARSKPSSTAKQGNDYSRKESCASSINVTTPKNHVRQKEFEILAEVNQKRHIRPALRSHCTTDSQQLVVKPADSSDSCQSEPQQQTSILMDEETPPRNIYSLVCNMNSQASYIQIGSPPMALDSLNQTQFEVHSDSSNSKRFNDMHEDLCPTDTDDNICMYSEAESSHVGSKLDNSSMHVLQKWNTVEGKDSMVLKTSHINDNLSDSSAYESVHSRSDSKSAEVEVLSSDTHYMVPLPGGALQCLNLGKQDIDCSSPEADELVSKLRSQSHRAGEFDDVLALSKCHLTHEVKSEELSEFEIDLDKIIQAVNDTYKLQISGAVDAITCGPFADFERLIHNASPVIDQIYSINSFKSCSREESIDNLLCSHQIPNISLGSLWQWYEKPGCYGLEVKVEDHCNLQSLRNGHFQFCAYFVPFLSAVQLFSRSNIINDVNLKGAATIDSEVDKKSNTSSNLGSLRIFSLLLPRPRKLMDACFSDSSSSAKDAFSNQSVKSTCLGEEELIFEFFESKQPHQRRPLFEKIKELVRGDALSNCQLFGDPRKLECLNLHDLHPASWYSVAWYPIYRIPDGNFHAAFLTYHSLGHFVDRTAPGGLTQIVSSVVGLQSYNAKGEKWFEPRGSKSKVVRTEGSSTLDPSKLLEDRLRGLERTARVMATASVRKGDRRSVNKQPDYEFFSQRL